MHLMRTAHGDLDVGWEPPAYFDIVLSRFKGIFDRLQTYCHELQNYKITMGSTIYYRLQFTASIEKVTTLANHFKTRLKTF